MEIRYLYASRFNKSWYCDFLKVFQWIKKHFCVSNQKISSFSKVYPNRFLYLHTFLRKTPWTLYDPFITFRIQMWTINYMHISKSFSMCLWNIFENITGMPLRGRLLAARYLTDGWTCSLPLGKAYYICGKWSFLRHWFFRFAQNLSFEILAFFD